LIVEAHRLVFRAVLDAFVQLFGSIVHQHEAVVVRIAQGAIRSKEVDFLMRLEPFVIQIRRRAPLRVMKRIHQASVIVAIGIEAR
jgi:hypothetical protein